MMWYRPLLPVSLFLLAGLLAGCEDATKKDDAQDTEKEDAGKKSDQSDSSKLKDKLLGKEKDNKTLAKVHNANGLAATTRGDFATAAREFSKAIELDDQPDYYNNLGRCYYWLARYKDALIAFAKAEELGMKEPEIVDLYSNIADTYRMQNNTQKAVLYYQKSISLNTKYLRAHYELGHMYLKLGDYKNAEERLNLVLKLDPGNNKAILDRLILYRMTNRFELAYNDMLTLDKRGYDIRDDLRDQILDGVKKQKEREAAGR